MHSATLRAYRWLLKLYPAPFRDEYERELERQVREELAESGSGFAVAKLWLRLLADFALSLPVQFAREAWQDGRHALRQWARRPLNTGFAIAALAIGIGATVGVFSVVNTLLLRSLPFRDPDRLAVPSGLTISVPNWNAKDWFKGRAYFEDTAFFDQGDVNVGDANTVLRVRLTETSANFFPFLGAQPVRGRAFLAGEDTPGRDALAVISYGLWQQLFAGDSRALGATIRTEGVPLTIVGVAPPGFDYPQKTGIWTPSTFDSKLIPKTGFFGMRIVRVKKGVPWAQAEAGFRTDATALAPERANPAHPAYLTQFRDMVIGPVKTASLILLAAVALILLIACTNVANLLLARTASRANELTIRSALGAGRGRLLRQLLTESILLALASSVAGLAVAEVIARIATAVQPAPIASQSYSIFDASVLGFAFAISILCGVMFGAFPALHAARAHKFAARGSNVRQGSRMLRQVLVAAQVMLTIILLASSLTLGRAFLNLLGMDRGFDHSNVVTLSLSVQGTKHKGDGALAYFDEAVQRVRGLPGVRSASLAEFLPLKFTPLLGSHVDGQPARETSMVVPVFRDYFDTLGGRILYGREFSDAEIQSNTKVAVVSDRLARELGEPAAIVGRQIHAVTETITVIGVVKDMFYIGDEQAPQIYVPDHNPGRYFATLVARVDGRAEDRLAMIREAVKSVDPQVPVYDVKTMNQLLDDSLVIPKFYSGTILFFAAFALLLAIIGIYGAVAYAVEQRTHEMGVRLALGTTPARLRASMLGQGLVAIIAAAIPGIGGAMLAGKLVQSLIDGAKPTGLDACAAAFLLIAATAAAANWTATRRVSRLDVMEVLRAE